MQKSFHLNILFLIDANQDGYIVVAVGLSCYFSGFEQPKVIAKSTAFQLCSENCLVIWYDAQKTY